MSEWKEYKLETVPSTSSGTGEPPVIELVTGTEETVVEHVTGTGEPPVIELVTGTEETVVELVETTVSPVETTTDDTN